MTAPALSYRSAPETYILEQVWTRLVLGVLGVVLAVVFNRVYADFVQPMFGYTGMMYDPYIRASLLPVVAAAAFVPLVLLSPRLQPAHLFALVVFVYVFQSILTVAPHFLGLQTFWPISLIVAISMVIIVLAANMRLPVRPKGHPQLFQALLFLAVALTAGPILVMAAKTGLKFPGFTSIYELRAELEHQGFVEYAIHIYATTVGPLLMAYALTRRRWFAAIAAASIFVVIYGLKFTKAPLFAPLFVVTLWLLVKFVKTPRPWHALAFYGGPLVLTYGLVALWPERLGATLTALVLHRTYTMPGQIFAHYVDFFSSNPYTWFSHIKGISWFVTYPYDDVLPFIIKDHYPGGNQNATFWTQDAVAGAGIYAIPFVSLFFGAMLILINTAARGLDAVFVIPAVAMAAQRFTDGSLPTALLSGGIAFLIVLLWLMPRSERVAQND